MKAYETDRHMNIASAQTTAQTIAQTAAQNAVQTAARIASLAPFAQTIAQTAAQNAVQTAATSTRLYDIHKAFSDGWNDIAISEVADSALEYLNPVDVLASAWRALDYSQGCIISDPNYSNGYFVNHSIVLLGVHKTVSSRGHGVALRYRPNKSEWDTIMQKIASAPTYAPIISRVVTLTGDGNRGEQFERAFTHMDPDKKPFWIRADYESGSGTWSIKGSGATLINRSTMIEALRFCREYAPTRFYNAMIAIFSDK